MSENLMRVEMSYGYDCKRVVDVARYSGDVMPDGKVYRDPSKKNRASEIGLGEIWVTYDDNGKTPVFKANVIVIDNGDYSQLFGIMIRMSDSIKRIMEVSAKDFLGRVSGISIDESEAKAAIELAVSESTPSGRVRVDLHSLSGMIMKKAFDDGCLFCGKRGMSLDLWKSFFENRVTESIVVGILRESPAVKCVGDYADFESDAVKDNVARMISLKIASDGVSRLSDDSGKQEEAK